MRAPSPVDQANALVRHLGDQIGISSMSLDERGCCLLLVARRWALSLVLDASHETLYLSCPVTGPGQLEAIPPAVWVAWLQAQHLGGASSGATVAVDPEGRVCMQQALHLPSAVPARLLDAIELLLGRAAQWAARLAQPDSASAPVMSGSSSAATLPAMLHHTRI